MCDPFHKVNVMDVTVSGDVTTHTTSRTCDRLPMLDFLAVPAAVEVLCAKSR